MANKPNRKTTVTTISLPPQTLVDAWERAESFGVNFSFYIRRLIEDDLDHGANTMTISAKLIEK